MFDFFETLNGKVVAEALRVAWCLEAPGLAKGLEPARAMGGTARWLFRARRAEVVLSRTPRPQCDRGVPGTPGESRLEQVARDPGCATPRGRESRRWGPSGRGGSSCARPDTRRAATPAAPKKKHTCAPSSTVYTGGTPAPQHRRAPSFPPSLPPLGWEGGGRKEDFSPFSPFFSLFVFFSFAFLLFFDEIPPLLKHRPMHLK